MWILLASVLCFKMREWSYLIFAAAGVGVAALKGFLYAHVLGEIEYAAIGYYLLALGVGGLLVGSGVILRAHSELPSMELAQRFLFVAQGRTVGFAFWLLLSLPSVIAGSLLWDFSLTLLTQVQVLVMFLFTLDVVARKSDGDFFGYARAVFLRNLLLLFGGLAAAYLTGSAWFSILAEVVLGFFACGTTVVNWVLNFRLPDVDYVRRCFSFIPVSLLGGLGQYVDRLCASFFLPAVVFSAYSYLSLLMVGALAIQQIVNTKVITLLAVRCKESPRDAFAYLLKVSGGVFLIALLLMACAAYVLFFSWFSASWVSVDIIVVVLFVLGVSCRAAEFFSSFLIVMHKKKLLAGIQFVGLFVYAILSVVSYSSGFVPFVVSMVSGMIFFTAVLALVSWRVSFA